MMMMIMISFSIQIKSTFFQHFNCIFFNLEKKTSKNVQNAIEALEMHLIIDLRTKGNLLLLFNSSRERV